MCEQGGRLSTAGEMATSPASSSRHICFVSCGWWFQPKKLVFACPQLALAFSPVQILSFHSLELPWDGSVITTIPLKQSGRRKLPSLFHEHWLAIQHGLLHSKKLSPQGPIEGLRSDILEYFLGKVPEEGPGSRVCHPIKKPWCHKLAILSPKTSSCPREHGRMFRI